MKNTKSKTIISEKREARSEKISSYFKFTTTNSLLPAFCFLLLLSSCGNNKEEKQAKIENRNVPTVSVANPETHQFDASITISGMAKPNQQVKIFALSNGYLDVVKVDIGDFVKEGQILAIMKNPELFDKKSILEAELKGKKSIYFRLKSIYEKTPQLTTVVDVEKSEADYESNKAQLNAVKQQINFLTVKAPFSGVIVNRFLDKGTVIQSGLNNSNALALFELQDIQPIRLTLDIPEADAAVISKGTNATITFPELPNVSKSLNVSRIAYGLSETSKTMKVEIDIPNSDLKIRPRMYAKVDLQRNGQKNALSVTNEAVGNIKGQSFIYVVENSKVRKVEVKTGITDEKFTELLSGDIKPTDKIVVQGKEFCSDGATVQTKELTTK